MKKTLRNYYIILLVLLVLLPTAFFAVFGRFFDTTNYENRTLAAFPATATLEDAENFPGRFESWFNDHLPFRNQFVTLNGILDYEVLGTASSESVILGKDGWLFYKGAQVNDEDPVADYQGTNLYSEEELSLIRTNMLAARDELAGRGCEFIIFIAPNKERIYSEYMPDAYGAPGEENRLRQVTEYLQNTTDLTVICPYEDLMNFRKEHPELPIYYKYDTHWNYLGSYVGVEKLVNALGYYHPTLEQVTLAEAEPPVEDLATLLHLGQYLTDDKAYLIQDYTTMFITSESSDDHTEFRYHNEFESGDQRKLFVIGDSFSTMMGNYIACNFNDTYTNFYYNYNYELLLREQPDIVVYETVERYMNNMLHFSIVDGIDAEPEN